MVDDGSKRDRRDRARVATEEEYDVHYFAQANGISEELARTLLELYGNDRSKLEAEVQKMKKYVGALKGCL